MDRYSSELFVLLLLWETFLRFLAGLPTSLWNNWLPRQRILSVHRPWRQGQLRDKKQKMHNVCFMAIHKKYLHGINPQDSQQCVSICFNVLIYGVVLKYNRRNLNDLGFNLSYLYTGILFLPTNKADNAKQRKKKTYHTGHCKTSQDYVHGPPKLFNDQPIHESNHLERQHKLYQ